MKSGLRKPDIISLVGLRMHQRFVINQYSKQAEDTLPCNRRLYTSTILYTSKDKKLVSIYARPVWGRLVRI